MATFLVGWELGSERGHMALLEPVVAALRRRGHRVAVAVKDLGALPGPTSSLLQGPVFQAPVWPSLDSGLDSGQASREPMAETVGDDLIAVGLGNEQDVFPRARAWADLIATVGADVVLAECAPTLLLAARRRCRAIAFGSAYSLPPAGRPLPPVLAPLRPPSGPSAAREAALRLAFDGADRALGGGGLACFSDLFAVDTWVCNLAELDPYASLRPAAAAGPLDILQFDAAAQFPAGSALGDRVFVYAKPFPVLPRLMEALAPRCRQLEIFVSNAPSTVVNPWPHVQLHRQPIDIPRRLRDFSAVVHFGGLNLTAEALFAGVPQLILPMHLEQSATALAVQRLGVGHCQLGIPQEPDRESDRVSLVAEVVERFFASGDLGDRAREFGVRLRARQKPSLQGLVSLCEDVAGRGAVWKS